MHLPHFEYLAPRSTDELADMLAEHREGSRILAGGTDLMLQMLRRDAAPARVIDIQHIEALRRLEYSPESGLEIGALVTIEELADAEIVREKYRGLHQGALVLGSPQVRAMATVGGNSCNASPCADTPPPLIAHGARVNLVSCRGRRSLRLEEFILDNRAVALAADEFLESFSVPEPVPGSASRYEVIGLRNAVEIDLVSVAVVCAVDAADGRITHIRVVMGSVAPTPLRARLAEAELLGRVPTDSAIDLAGSRCAEESRPIDDLRASAAYRRAALRGLFGRTLRAALAEIA